MPSVKPITVNDLNGVEFNPGEMIIDDLIGYVGYAKSLCTDLGTEQDTPAGYQDFLSFQKEIQSAHISTFEPAIIDDKHSFETLDLTGANLPLREYPLVTYAAFVNRMPFFSYTKGVSPFDLPQKGEVRADKWLSPFDIDGFEELYLTSQKLKEENLNLK
jgi:hypothetical protein